MIEVRAIIQYIDIDNSEKKIIQTFHSFDNVLNMVDSIKREGGRNICVDLSEGE